MILYLHICNLCYSLVSQKQMHWWMLWTSSQKISYLICKLMSMLVFLFSRWTLSSFYTPSEIRYEKKKFMGNNYYWDRKLIMCVFFFILVDQGTIDDSLPSLSQTPPIQWLCCTHLCCYCYWTYFGDPTWKRNVVSLSLVIFIFIFYENIIDSLLTCFFSW
jgi:hypothetical protein